MTCPRSRDLPYDLVGGAVLDDDGQTLHLIDGISPEMVELIRTSAHRLEVRVAFVPDEHRLRDIETGELL